MLCPLCGKPITPPDFRHLREGREGELPTLPSAFLCAAPGCGFSVDFTFDRRAFYRYSARHLRERTAVLSPDRRMRALFRSLGYSRVEGNPAYIAEIEGLIVEALGEIEALAEELIAFFSHREPDDELLRRKRKSLESLLRFFTYMEGQYPDKASTERFQALSEKLTALDCYFEVGSLYPETNPQTAADYYAEGMAAGGLRSHLALINIQREVLGDEGYLEALSALAPLSQEACEAYAENAVVGRDNIAGVFLAYLAGAYRTCPLYGRIAFIQRMNRLLSAAYEPYLRTYYEDESPSTLLFSGETAEHEGVERVLGEMKRLCRAIADELSMLRIGAGAECGEETILLDCENLRLEYRIGVSMYYALRASLIDRLNTYLLEEILGHFVLFLQNAGEEDIEERRNAEWYCAALRALLGRKGEDR